MVMALNISNTLGFGGTPYYYRFDDYNGTSTNRWLVANCRSYATYWCFAADTVYGKNVSSVVINVTASSYNISSGKQITFFAAVAPLGSTSNIDSNAIVRANRSKFGAYTAAVTLPTSGSAPLDITSLIQYAAANYNQAWGLYLIGGAYGSSETAGNVGYASKVVFSVPKFTTLEMDLTTDTVDTVMFKIHNGSNWVNGMPYVHNGTTWVQAAAVYLHNGIEWVQV